MADAPCRLWLLRHAQPLIAPGTCYGQLDVPADAVLTQKAARTLQPLLPPETVLRHSPLQRCAQLASAIACTTRIPDARLQEMHFGHWEGQAWNAIARAELDAWANTLAHYAPGGGENLSTMLMRVRQALHTSWHHDSVHGTRDVLWVTHAGVVRCVQWLQRHPHALPHSADWNLPAPAFGGWITLDWSDLVHALE